MGFTFAPFVIGVILTYLKIKGHIQTENKWIVLCFGIWFVFVYIKIHMKNRERDTPRPVYLANQ